MEAPPPEISYAAWGRAFFREAVSVERVLAAVNVLSGQPVDLIVVDLRAQGLRASLTKHAARVQGELQRFVARYVAREVEKDYVLRVRTIDVSAAIDRALVTLAPQRPV